MTEKVDGRTREGRRQRTMKRVKLLGLGAIGLSIGTHHAGDIVEIPWPEYQDLLEKDLCRELSDRER